jgi:quercetin dioxygenase-like cupin family protein
MTPEVFALDQLAQELLAEAAGSPARRATRVLVGRHGSPLHQLLLALETGAELSEHANPGQATLQVLQGRVTLRASDEATASAGALLAIPDEPHSVLAHEPSVVLLTLAHRAS